ncbi:hypothetical protein AA14337_0760 [Acetobacter malorum DSM 14337]|uniref:Lipoprotein n=1 Tax=Acetobacter malorum DSM 14337 TaxID=1307910 RepID=A0ABQ0PP84_9PROT|nr:hypothetical protein [Acetobacter malorum]KXV08732.1 hypothetical protein AD930_03740 [Acetobacter malorum]GBQ77240.1 hypothetical protein AA14337_0760 [Acetobacter malorum DSM 14337]
MKLVNKFAAALPFVAALGLSACAHQPTPDEQTQHFLAHTMQEEQIVVPRNPAQQQSDRNEINRATALRGRVEVDDRQGYVQPQPSAVAQPGS